ncbi:MAG: hypothetical protein AAF938_09230 [Myxococcota bacterium]
MPQTTAPVVVPEGDSSRGIPPFAQLAARIDVEAIQSSTLGPRVRQFLTHVPNWDLLLNGSGIEQLQDLERVLLASPNLSRANFVLVVRHAHPDRGRAFIDEMVTRMHEARGRPVNWRRVEGVDVVDWPNIDRIARVLAVVGPRHFVICRDRDLARVLAVAQTRAEWAAAEDADQDGEAAVNALRGTAADALLSMDEGTGFSMEIEGIRRFVRRATDRHPDQPSAPISVVPTRISISVRDTGEGVSMSGFFHYPDEETAGEGFTVLRERIDAGIAAAPVFLRGCTRAFQVAPDGSRVSLGYETNYPCALVMFGLAEGWLRARRQQLRNSRTTPEPLRSPGENP